MKPKLKENVIYVSDNGMLICRKCAGQSALYTGRDISGQRVEAMPKSYAAEWKRDTGHDLSCDRGCTSY